MFTVCPSLTDQDEILSVLVDSVHQVRQDAQGCGVLPRMVSTAQPTALRAARARNAVGVMISVIPLGRKVFYIALQVL